LFRSSDVIVCQLTHTVSCAHQKPITALKAAAGRLVTGSQDHTLRVSSLFLTEACLGVGELLSCTGGAMLARVCVCAGRQSVPGVVWLVECSAVHS